LKGSYVFQMKENSKRKRVAIYIDGSNLYFSIKKTFKCKIDIEKFCKKLIGDDYLIKINYYIASIEQFNNPEMYAEQQSFFEKIKRVEKLAVILGRLEKRKREGDIYYVEKASDVNLALDLVLDSQKGIYNGLILFQMMGIFLGQFLLQKILAEV